MLLLLTHDFFLLLCLCESSEFDEFYNNIENEPRLPFALKEARRIMQVWRERV
jgi:hypothetical protein